MKTQVVKIASVNPSPNNPRIIKDNKFKKLVKSIQEFPEMLKLRPIVVDDRNFILGGNMRYKACVEAGLKEIPVIKATDLTEEQKQEFVIKDNSSFGEWDWDVLANEWDNTKLNDWGMDVWEANDDIDYSILDDDEGFETSVDDMKSNSKKAVMIEFDILDFDEAYQLVKFFREQGDLGKTMLHMMRAEKKKMDV
tara:strand:+ start:2747 stop:3331 length:585 start_codon:yes stop_codon:yes gene_type:complete